MAKRGPCRSKNSPVKQRCAYKLCKSKKDVKNVGKKLQLSRSQIQKGTCRVLRSHIGIIKFCSDKHVSACRKQIDGKKRGGREALNHEQAVKLFQVLASIAPWAAVLMLTQLFLAERADCARQVCWSWLRKEKADSPASSMQIPRCNGKTTARNIGLYQPFAKLLNHWTQNPLTAPSGKSWPIEGQQLWVSDLPLFPGYDHQGQKRDWAKPVSEKAYYEHIRHASRIIAIQRKEATTNGASHSFDHFDLARLGTHSMKKRQ